ncbi:MAG TPA: tetratricopeptide repeat protein [Bacteroidota bacterium]|nr:tetratricopeptide repeat protein [Bacteroidota bacterium]
MLTARKRAVFAAIPALALIALVALTECALRLFAPSLAEPFVREVDVDSLAMLQVNRSFLERYFPAGSPMVPELKPTLLRKVKVPGLFRVLCVGESTMFGTPYELCATIPALVRKQVRHIAPGASVEVINVAASAINSNVVRDMAPRLAALQPDVVLVYLGHNEFYGPDGTGAPWLEKRFPALTPLKYRLRDMRLVRLAQKALTRMVRPGGAAGEKNLMKQVSGGATVAAGSAEEDRIFGRFADNLRAIFREFRSRGIPVIACDVTSNLLFPPFISPHDDGRVPPLVASGRSAEALALLGDDTTDAFASYWRGRILLARGDAPAAAVELRRARDEDLLKFRAPGRIDAIIRGVCAVEGVPCCAADSLFVAESPAGIPGWSLFWEHLHPNVRGYDLIARMYVRAMIALGIVPGASPARPPGLLPFDPDSLSLSWVDLAYGEVSVRGLTGRWPFTDFRSPAPLMDSADAFERSIAIDLYEKKTGWTDACLKFASHAEGAHNVRGAMRTYGALEEEYPFEYYPPYRLASLLRDAGDLERAAAEYRRSIALNGAYLSSRLELGLILNNTGEFAEARAQLGKALALAGGGEEGALPRAEIFYGLAALSANTGDIARARDLIARSIREYPSYAPARALERQLEGKK